MKQTNSFVKHIVPIFLSALVMVPLQPNTAGAAEPAAMDSVLGDAAGWTINPPASAVTTDGPTNLLAAAPAQYIILESKGEYSAPTEYLMMVRLRPAKGATASASLQMAAKTLPDKTAQALAVSISATEGQETVNYHTSLTHAKNIQLSGALGLQAVAERSLAWSEELRRTIEAQMAQAPKLADSTFTVRATVERGLFRTYLNGRFLHEIVLPPGMDASGVMKMQLHYGAQLVSIRARPLKPLNALFEPVFLDSHLNASAVAGRKIARTSLPTAGQPAPVDGVPFAFPAPTSRGDDHVDVGASWTRFGALPGYIASNFGTFGGRWIAANKIDPSRIAMYVPTRRYKALHLIAVADGGKDEVPVVTAQFYRPDAGHPYNFAGRVPDITGKSRVAGKAVSVKTADGKTMQLYHVVVPLDPDAFSWFSDLNRIGLEITKQVEYYRAYPDPLEYSWHGGGLPSSVQIYAMTLEREGVDIDIQPDQFGHVWTAPAAPGYTVELRNNTGAVTTARLSINTSSQDGQDKTQQEQTVNLPANNEPVKVSLPLKPSRYGLHDLSLTLGHGGDRAVYRRNFAYLHPDTRERGNWEEGKGPVFGYWAWGGGHDTPPPDKEITVMGAAGAETSTANYQASAPEIRALAEKWGFISENAFSGGSMYYAGFYSWYQGAPKWDPADPEGSGKALVEALRPTKNAASAISRPTFLPFFAEPQIGTITTGIWPSYYGEDYKLTEAEQATFADMKAKYLAGARAIRKEWPDIKLLLPYGDPMNAAVFLRLAPESRDLIDGVALDLPGFERTPEQQINQVVLNRMYPIFKDIKQYKPNPYFVLIEGFCISSKDIDTGQQGQAEIGMRDFLVLLGYGINNFESNNAPFDCANYWGENHYGGGWLSRLPVAQPKLGYVHYATLTRHLNRANFAKYLPTGSTTAFCQQFKHYKDGHLVHTLWNVRGKRQVTLQVSPEAKPVLYDGNDNATTLPVRNGAVTFTISETPVYLEGLTADPTITLGESDHSDSRPGKDGIKLANLGDGSWQVTAQRDDEYEKNKPLQVERFLAKMTTRSVAAPKEQGTKALAVHLEKQEKERGVMPYYTTLEPRAPVTIPGKASHLGLWVKASSDWGRVVYDLRDAKGEKWISVGFKEDWNNDDIHTWSAFNFDGWRYVQFQLPSNLPYDSYRERGSSWWGHYGGDGIVDLPLKLQKVIVERRNQIIYGNDLVPAKPDDVLLGDLLAEYSAPADKTPETVRLSKLRMPLPQTSPEMSNPIADLKQTGVGAPTRVLRVADPTFQFDGTRTHVHFDLVPGAKSYDVWVSPYADGRGALKLGSAWTESGKLIEGLRPGIEFYAFVTYTDQADKVSKPSAPLKFVLTGRFGYK